MGLDRLAKLNSNPMNLKQIKDPIPDIWKSRFPCLRIKDSTLKTPNPWCDKVACVFIFFSLLNNKNYSFLIQYLFNQSTNSSLPIAE
jgi:hypothetical protein